MGEMVAGGNAGKKTAETPILDGNVALSPIQGGRSAQWWDQ